MSNDPVALSRAAWVLTTADLDPERVEAVARQIAIAGGLDPEAERIVGFRGSAWNPHRHATPFDILDEEINGSLPTWCFFSSAASQALTMAAA